MATTRTPRKTTPATADAEATPAPRNPTVRKTTPAKKAAAQRTPAKKATPAAEAAPAADRTTAVTLVKRPVLPVRRRLFVGPMGPSEQAAIRAALASAALRLPVPVRTWNGSTAQLGDGTLLIHNPGPDRVFTAHIACRHGAIHGWPITSSRDLGAARALTHTCERPHTQPTGQDGIDDDWDTAIRARAGQAARPRPRAIYPVRAIRAAEASKSVTQAVTGPGDPGIAETIPIPVTDHTERALADTLVHSDASTADTQALPAKDIAAGLAARADQDQPKEHPEP